MEAILSTAADNLGSPMILCFVLGVLAALARSDLSFPEAVAKGMSLYLLFAIGFKGGVGVAEHGGGLELVAALGGGVALAAALPFAAYASRRATTGLGAVDAAAIAAHYGSISIVTFVTATLALEGQGITFEGYMVAVAAAMEAPAILSALWLAARSRPGGIDGGVWREILVNGSIVLLLGAFGVGWITGTEGMADIAPFVGAPFKGVLCLFLLDMGLVTGRGLMGSRAGLGPALIGFGVAMPLIGGSAGMGAALLLGLSPGGMALLAVLAASASYIAVPAAMRVALPEANPAPALALALGVTFPFNLVIGIPAAIAASLALTGAP
ncbi:MAG: sodium-dependent bicarbonate transport family permease [Gemmobacter sp.]